MKKPSEIKEIFDRYGGMMRTCQLYGESVYYRDIAELIAGGYIKKVRYGYYQWIDHENLSEAFTITHLFPDGIFCMDTALCYYGYSVRTPAEWHIAVSKDSGKSRFNIDYPFVKPYYVEPSLLLLGMTDGEMDGNPVKIYDKERVICDCLRYRNKMDKKLFNKAIQNYIADPGKRIANLTEYAAALRVNKPVRDLIGVWL